MNVTAITAGGFACTLLSDEGPPQGTQVVVRITQWAGVDAHVANHRALTEVIPWGVPKLVGAPPTNYATIADLPRNYLEAMQKQPACGAKLEQWRSAAEAGDNTPITVYRMEYANRGTFATYQWSNYADRVLDAKRFTFLAIGLIYAANWRLGFQHSDLTPTNLLVHHDDEGMGVPIPWLIDFDLATFGAPRKIGSLYVAPPEVFLQPLGVAPAAPPVPCSYDIWSLGMCLLAKAITPIGAPRLANAQAIVMETYPGLQDPRYIRTFTYYVICCFHSLLTGRHIDRYQLISNERHLLPIPDDRLVACRTQFYDTVQAKYGDGFVRLHKDLRELLLRMLDVDPEARVFGGDMNSYFYEPYFTLLKDRSGLIARYIIPILGIAPMPNVMRRPIVDQVQALVAAGMELQCGYCGGRAHYVDMQLRGWVCKVKNHSLGSYFREEEINSTQAGPA